MLSKADEKRVYLLKSSVNDSNLSNLLLMSEHNWANALLEIDSHLHMDFNYSIEDLEYCWNWSESRLNPLIEVVNCELNQIKSLSVISLQFWNFEFLKKVKKKFQFLLFKSNGQVMKGFEKLWYIKTKPFEFFAWHFMTASRSYNEK